MSFLKICVDEFSNVIGKIKLDGNTHTFTLNKKLTPSNIRKGQKKFLKHQNRNSEMPV